VQRHGDGFPFEAFHLGAVEGETHFLLLPVLEIEYGMFLDESHCHCHPSPTKK
jgi:hypothetical protein